MTLISLTHTEKHENSLIKLKQSSTLSANNGRGFGGQFTTAPHNIYSFISSICFVQTFSMSLNSILQN